MTAFVASINSAERSLSGSMRQSKYAARVIDGGEAR